MYLLDLNQKGTVLLQRHGLTLDSVSWGHECPERHSSFMHILNASSSSSNYAVTLHKNPPLLIVMQ